MNNIGTVTCCRCKNTYDVTDALYYDLDEGVSFRLKKKGLGYVAHIFKIENPTKKLKITVEDVELVNGIPFQVTVLYKGDKITQRKVFWPEDRICPHCAQKTIVYLMYRAGYYPSYIISEMGSPATGKSTWLRAVSSQTIDKKIEDAANNCSIEICDAHEAQIEKELDPTTEAVLGYHALKITQNDRIVAMVYLIDMAGEFTKIKSARSSEFGNLLGFLRKQTDGVFAFYDPRYITSEKMKPYLEKRNERIEGNFENLFTYFKEFKRTPPVGFIMTGADEIKKVIKKNGVLTTEYGKPLLTEKSPVLRKCVVTERDIVRHMIISKDFIHEATNIRVAGKDNEGYFLVSSGENAGEKEFDYNTAYNVEFPLLWMLNQLGLAEISD